MANSKKRPRPRSGKHGEGAREKRRKKWQAIIIAIVVLLLIASVTVPALTSR